MITTTLEAVCESVRYGYTESATTDPVGPHFLRITDIVPQSIDWESVPFCKIDENHLAKYKLFKGDIVVARTGATVGYAKLIREAENSVFASYLVRFRVDRNMADPGYVGRVIESVAYKEFIWSRINGAAQPNASAPVLGSFEFRLPSLVEQKQIAAVLTNYDDLIATNQRRIALLEDAARRLYREWFVNLRFPGHETLPLKDGVPEGWLSLPLTDCADFINGFAFKPEHQQEVGLPIVKIPELRDGVSSKTPKNSGVSVPSRNHIDTGDVLFSWSATLLVNEWSEGPALLNQHLFKVVPKHTSHKRLIRFAVEVAIPLLLGQSVGATMQHIRRSALAGHLVLVPDQPVADAFAAIVDPMMDMVLNLQAQNRHLRATRDSLLPKLMSGQLDVSGIHLPEEVAA